MTHAEWVAALKNPDDELRQLFEKIVKNQVRVALGIEAHDGTIAEPGDVTAAIDHAINEEIYTSPGLYARLQQTVYEQVNKVLDERGFVATVRATWQASMNKAKAALRK